MVRTVRQTFPRANMNPPNAPPLVTARNSDTVDLEVQAACIAWCNGEYAQSYGSLFSALPDSEHPCWTQFLSRPMILDNQTTAANTLRQPRHDILGGSYPAVYYPESIPAELDSWQMGLSNPWDRYHQHAPSPIDDTHRRATSAQPTRPILPRLVVDSPQVSRHAYTATPNMYSGESVDNDWYRSPVPDLLQPNYPQGRSPSSSGSDGCHSPGSDSSWVAVDAGDAMDIDHWIERVPEEQSYLDSRHGPEEVLNHGGRESGLEVERTFAVSDVSNDRIRDEPVSDIASAGLSPHSGRRATFNDIACLRCQLKRVTVSVPSVRVSETWLTGT